MKLLRIFLAVYAVLLWGSAVAGPEYEKLIGKWKMQSASIQLPDTCNSMTFQFLADGTYIGDDGSMVMTMKYDIVEDGGDLLLNFFRQFQIMGNQTARDCRRNTFASIHFENL